MATATREDTRTRPFLIAGADGPIEVPAGEFYINPKAHPRRMMENHLSSEARRVYACLELHTMGFHQEKAVIKEPAGIRPLATADISRETGLTARYVRRALVELEEQGLAKRRGTGADPDLLQRGKVEIYSWAVPRTPTKGNPGGSALPPFPYWFPQSWEALKPLITRLKLNVSIDEEAARCLLLEGEEAARIYQEGLEAAERFLERVCATAQKPALNKEERTEIYKEKEPSGGQAEKASTVVEEPPPPETPARPQEVDLKITETPKPPTSEDSVLRAQLRAFLTTRPIPTPLDTAMYERIARWIPDEEHLERFRQAAESVRNPRKWPVYEGVARQVHERGSIPKPPPAEESTAAREYREWLEEERAKNGRSAKAGAGASPSSQSHHD